MTTSESILNVFGQAVAYRDALRDLVRALPQCRKCTRPATCGPVALFAERFCDEHGGDFEEYGYAAALRHAIAVLKNER